MKLKVCGFAVAVPKVIFHRELFIEFIYLVIEFYIIGPQDFYEKMHRIFKIEYLL